MNDLDDIAIVADTEKELKAIYEKVLLNLKRFKLKINWSKCYLPWAKNKGANIFLGFAIRDKGFAIPKAQQEKIIKLTRSNRLKAAQTLNYFRILSVTALRWFEKL